MNIVKREKNKNYTTISNVFLRDKNLSIKAKGLLAVVMSLPEDWEFTINGICSVLKEGRTAIYSAIQELKDCGYCNVDICRDEKGLITGNDYTFREYPKKESQCLEEPHSEKPNADDNTQRNKEETNNRTDKVKSKEERDKSLSKKERAQELINLWNNETKDFPKVRKVSPDVLSDIDKLLKRGYSYVDMKKAIILCNSLSDFYKGKERGKTWKATLQWLIHNTNDNFDKIMNGALHTSQEQQRAYISVMSCDDSSNEVYSPTTNGTTFVWNETLNCYMYVGNISNFFDGYTNENRPNGAQFKSFGYTYTWDAVSKQWDKE